MCDVCKVSSSRVEHLFKQPRPSLPTAASDGLFDLSVVIFIYNHGMYILCIKWYIKLPSLFILSESNFTTFGLPLSISSLIEVCVIKNSISILKKNFAISKLYIIFYLYKRTNRSGCDVF